MPVSSVSSAPPFRAGRYVVDVPDGWTDQSTYLLSGPTVDDLVHTIGITVEPNPDADSLDAYATNRTEAALESLDSAERLLTPPITLDDGATARRTILRWKVDGEYRYLDQMYVHTGAHGYVVGATFTDASRREIGPDILDVMRSFAPHATGGSTKRLRTTAFSINVPDGWTDRSTYLRVGPTVDGVPHSVRVLLDRDVEADTVRAYAAAGVDAAVDALDGGELVSAGDVPLADGATGRRAVIAWDARDDRRLLQAHLYRLDGDHGCIVAASFVPGADATVLDAVDGILRSVRPSAT